MLMDDGAIITGVRHYSPEMRATLKRIYSGGLKIFGHYIIKPYHLRVKEQGFVDQFGKFLNREEAYVIAELNNQIIENFGGAKTLYSESLY